MGFRGDLNLKVPFWSLSEVEMGDLGVTSIYCVHCLKSNFKI